jgi:hypothetical protein
MNYVSFLLLFSVLAIFSLTQGEKILCGHEGLHFGFIDTAECNVIIQQLKHKVDTTRVCHRHGVGCDSTCPPGTDCVLVYAPNVIRYVDVAMSQKHGKLQCEIGTFSVTTHRWTDGQCLRAKNDYETCVESNLQVERCFAVAIAFGEDPNWMASNVLTKMPENGNLTQVRKAVFAALDTYNKALEKEVEAKNEVY